MCRHLAYVGPPVTIASLLVAPPHGLVRQSWEPRRQRHGLINADGFGVGWYADGDPLPARYRRAVPIWADPSFADIARVTRTGALVAAVRSATAGTAPDESAAAPYGSGQWLFSHNGRIDGWPASVASLGERLPADVLLGLESRCDSALLWAFTQHLLRSGASLDGALAEVIATVAALAPARLNLILTDGHTIAATTWGDTLCYRVIDCPEGTGRGVVVASEPYDDAGDWIDVPDRSLLVAGTGGVTVRPLETTGSMRAPSTSSRPARLESHRTTTDPEGNPSPVTDHLTVQRRLPDGFLADALRADVRAGLTATPKNLPPKWFYDARGSELFEQITRLPEYYPTRAEREILTACAAEIAGATGAHTLVELGAGSAEKTRLLLDALRDAGTLHHYVPVDVSESALIAAGEALLTEYPGLEITAVVSDFDAHLGIPVSEGPRLVVFLGGTIGNLDPRQRAEFLGRVRADLGPDDALLIGTDLVKDPEVLVRAYDDMAGVTAEFNRNVLHVLNRELDADFAPEMFDHVAVWDVRQQWIEMRLRSRRAQWVKVRALDLAVQFAAGEEMRTEISAKFRREGITDELAAAGFALHRWWTDDEGRFGLSLATPLQDPVTPGEQSLDEGRP